MIHLCIVNSKATSTKIRVIYLYKVCPVTTASTKDVRDSFMYRKQQGDEYKIRAIYLCKVFSITTASTKDARDSFMYRNMYRERQGDKCKNTRNLFMQNVSRNNGNYKERT